MDIPYKVEFFTDWHCGSGLAAGADVDALVIKNENGLPFIPGKTIKGLLREAIEDIISFRYLSDPEKMNVIHDLFIEAFGVFIDNTDTNGKPNVMKRGNAFFTNAELPSNETDTILAEKLQPYLYRTLSSTAIGSDGIAVEHSLRKMEVAVPCVVYGNILGLPDNDEFRNLMIDAMRYVKRLGQNRNRGLGRCSVSMVEDSDPTKR